MFGVWCVSLVAGLLVGLVGCLDMFGSVWLLFGSFFVFFVFFFFLKSNFVCFMLIPFLMYQTAFFH